MINRLGYVLGRKHNYIQGITTRDNEIVEWPVALGALPDEATLTQWAHDVALLDSTMTVAGAIVTIKSAPDVTSVDVLIVETSQTVTVTLADGVGELDLSAHSGYTRTVRFSIQAVYGDAQLVIEVP